MAANYKNPFKRLSAFKKDEFKSFKGRDKELDRLFQYVMSGNTILIYGDSGVGKTSLVQCGLPNRLLETGCTTVIIRRCNNISIALQDQLIQSLNPENKESIQKLKKMTIPKLIREVFLENFAPVYLIFDQFEDFFNLSDIDERLSFINELKEIFSQKIACKLIFIIREDYHGKLEEITSSLPELFSHEMRLLPINNDIVENEILLNYLQNESGVSHIKCKPSPEIICIEILEACKDQNKEIYLPYMQVFLYKLWENAEKDEGENLVFFTQNLIRETGNMGNVIKGYLQECITEIDSEQESEIWGFLNEFAVSEKVVQPIKTSEIKSLPQNLVEKYVSQLIKKGILNQLPGDQIELAHFSLVPIIREKIPKYRNIVNTKRVYVGNPYKGLLPYTEHDQSIFFGRQKVKADLLKKINENNLTVIVGSSGSGKSSLIKAGILPELSLQEYVTIQVRPGSKPDLIIIEIKEFLESTSECKMVVYIDQFEELTTRCDDVNERQRFIDYINEISKSDFIDGNKLKILLSIRSDYEYEFISKFDEWKKIKFNIPFFTPDEIIEVITEPAQKAGLIFKPESLIDKIQSEVMSYSGTLPLLSYCLQEMYKEYKNSGRNDFKLTDHEYDASGGVIEGLKKRANTIFYTDYGGQPKYQETIRNIILRMSSLGINERAAKRVLPDDLDYGDDEKNKKVKEVLSKFCEKGLIIEGRDNEENVIFYEPSHDSLIRNWDLIGVWIEKFGKEIIFLQKNLVDAINSHKSGGPLWYDHANLQALLNIINSDNNWLNKEENEFIVKSEKKKKEVLSQKQQEQDEKVKLLKDALNEAEKAKKQEEKNTNLQTKLKRRALLGAALLAILLFVSLLSGYNWKKVSVQKDIALTRISLQNEPFYTSKWFDKDSKMSISTIDSFWKETFIDQLIQIKFGKNNLGSYDSLKNKLNKMSGKISEALVESNPNKGLILIEQAYEIYPYKFIDSIGLKYINTNLFYKFRITLNDKHFDDFTNINNPHALTISNDKTNFAFLGNNMIVKGVIKKNELIITDSMPFNKIIGLKSANDVLNIISLNFDENKNIAITNQVNLLVLNNNSKVIKAFYLPVNMANSFKSYLTLKSGTKKLIGEYNDRFIKIINLSNFHVNKIPYSFSSVGGFIKSIITNNEESKMLVQNSDNICWLVDLENNSRLPIGNGAPVFKASFVDGKKNIVYEAGDSVFICDYNGKMTLSSHIRMNLVNHRGNSPGRILLSDDFKTLFVSDNLGDKYIQRRTSKGLDSIFSFAKNIIDDTNIISNDLGPVKIIGYVNENTILAYSSSNDQITNYDLNTPKTFEISLYDIHPPFLSDFAGSVAKINPYLTTNDKEDIGILPKGERSLYKIALKNYQLSYKYLTDTVTRKNYLTTSKDIFEKLLNPISLKNEEYVVILKEIYDKLFTIDSDFNAVTKGYEMIIEQSKKLLLKYSADKNSSQYKDYKRQLSLEYGNIAFWYVFSSEKDHNKIIDAANKSLEIDTTADYSYTNLALGYLLKGDSNSAKNIYRKYKKEPCLSLKKPFKMAFLEDLDRLIYKGVITKRDEDLYDLIDRIKRYLNDKGQLY